MRREWKARGSLTVFLALLMAVLLGFSGVCLEYARGQAVSYQTRAAAEAAVESIFAGYHAPLLARYQLMARLVPQGDFSALEEENGRYASAWGGSSRENPSTGGSMVSFQVERAGWSEVVLATDDNGCVFAAMAADAVKSSAGQIAAGEWLKRLGLADDGETASTVRENAGKEELSASELLSGYGEWKDSVSAMEEQTAREQEEKLASGRGGEGEETAPEAGAGDEQESENRREGQKFLKLLETLRSTLRYGVLGLVIPEGKTISAGRVPAEQLPSDLSSAEKSRSVGCSLSSAGSGLLLREYLMRNMDCFTSEGEKTPAYELEYILAGKSSDEANLRAVVHRLLWIRTGMNLLYLSRSADKRAQVREAAVLAVGWTGQTLLVESMAGFLMTAWAFSEGIADLRSLLDGGKVALLKTDESWNLDFPSLTEVWEKGGNEADGWKPAQKEEKTEEGLSYEDYLRICLYLSPEQSLCYRAMDVIQWNIRTLDDSFVMADCMVSGSLTLTVVSQPVFFSLYGLILGKKNASWEYVKRGRFSYLS